MQKYAKNVKITCSNRFVLLLLSQYFFEEIHFDTFFAFLRPHAALGAPIFRKKPLGTFDSENTGYRMYTNHPLRDILSSFPNFLKHYNLENTELFTLIKYLLLYDIKT